MLLLRSLLFKATFLLLLSISQVALSAEKDWNRWSINNAESKDEVQYGPYDTILRTLIEDSSEIPSMRYSVLQDPEPSRYLETYSHYLQNIPVSQLNRDEQYAYWINLHKLGVIQLLVSKNGLQSRMKKA
jgi:hypothetical protein